MVLIRLSHTPTAICEIFFIFFMQHWGKETRYYWDQFRLCGEQTGTHRTQYIYYPDSFTPMCCLQDDKAYFYHTDHLGTPMEMTDEEGYRVWFGTYGTFTQFPLLKLYAIAPHRTRPPLDNRPRLFYYRRTAFGV